MKYVFCTQAVEGGAWNRLVEALEYLCDRGHTCHLIAYSNPDLNKLRKIERLSIHELDVSMTSRSTLRFAWKSYVVLRNIDLSGDEEVWCGGFAGNAGVSVGLIKCISSQSFKMFSFRRGAELERLLMNMRRKENGVIFKQIKKLIHIYVTKFVLNQSDLLITQTKNGLNSIIKNYDGYVPNSTEIIPNNINARWINRRIKEVKNSNSKKDRSSFRVCFVGRLSLTVKGIDTLIESAIRVRELPVTFDIVGDGRDEDNVKSLIQKYGLGDSFYLHGWMKNPLLVMDKADLVVVPSRSDPLPNVVLEALALGKPVVGSNVDGISVMLEYSDLLFEPNDDDRLANIIRNSVNDDEYINNLRKLSQKRAKHFRFNWGRRFEKLFKTHSRDEY